MKVGCVQRSETHHNGNCRVSNPGLEHHMPEHGALRVASRTLLLLRQIHHLKSGDLQIGLSRIVCELSRIPQIGKHSSPIP